MNYYKPRQRTDTKRWDYTQMRDKRTWPVGYCAGWREWRDLDLFTPDQNAFHKLAWEREVLPHREKYHDDGHATAGEACACYRAYLLDQRLMLNGIALGPDERRRCQAEPRCETFTNSLARFNQQPFVLCDEHRTREMVARIAPEVGEAISSW